MESKQVTTKQFVAVQFLIALAVKMFMLPALMLRIVGKDSYMVMIIWIAVEFVNLTLILLTAKRNPDKTMYDILTDAFGKVFSRIIVALLSLFIAVKGVLVISELKMFFKVAMYDDINWYIMLVPLMVVLCAFAVRSLRTIGRTSELLLPAVFVCTIILAGLLIGDMQGDNLLPFMSQGFSPVLKGLITFPMWFGDITFLLIFLGNIKITKGFMWAAYISKIIASALVLLFSCMLFATYGNISTLIEYGHNISNMTQFSLGSQDYGRFDLLFYCIWLFTVFIKLAVVFYFLTRNIGFIVGSRNNYVIAILTAVMYYALSQFVFNNENTVFVACTGVLKYIVCPPAMIMPFVIYFTALFKYKPNYHNGSLMTNGKARRAENGIEKSEKQSRTA